ncbi:two-component system sensor histidine kinase DcuS [Lactococcus hodotermopsidis]|uniref:histidine kinase n=1 Tax=Pseudolactococcus hodotermopsidis TaxID=2709157 RepID=A0A6A0B9G1_9LACT|nr:ATP-binding protein [Lactococcus hodotermopsidis]GFH42080.1 two-component system sensor histidine kinase DcuS [Lactococcus hodotermopsidis]
MKNILFNKRRKLSLQVTIIAVVCLSVTVSLIVSSFLIRNYVINREYDRAKDKISSVAWMVAKEQIVIETLTTLEQSQTVQNYTDDMQNLAKVDFVVVLDNNLTRYSHPNKSIIGQPFSNISDAKKSLNGTSHFSVQKGVLGNGLRFFTPVFDDNGKQIGIICVGLTLETINQEIFKAQKTLLVGIGLGSIVGLCGAIILARNLKRILLGLEPYEIATNMEEKQIIEDAVSDGIIALTADGTILMINREAKRILEKVALNPPLLDDKITETHLLFPLFKNVFDSQKKVTDEVVYLNGLELVTSVAPIFVSQQFYGIVATFRDQSEMKQLIEELSGTGQYIDALRAQTHGFMNRMHVILGLIELGKYDDVRTFITSLNALHLKEIGFISEKIKTPALTGFLLGKFNEASEQEILFILEETSEIPELEGNEKLQNILRILGNLLDNAKDAVSGKIDGQVRISLNYEEDGQIFIIQVSDNGSGISDSVKEEMFKRGFSTKGNHRGFGLNLVQNIVKNQKGILEVHSQKEIGTDFYIELPDVKKKEIT